MNSGKYVQERTGHELFNLEKNPVDGRFYGYCPPRDNINICANFGAKSRSGFVDDILVVYVTKKEKSVDREIIGFMPNARVHGAKQSGEKLSRSFFDGKSQTDVVVSYSVEGDILIDLRNRANKFKIEAAEYGSYMFRSQRYYGGHPDLNKKIIAYVEEILGDKDLLDDDLDDQKEIQRSEPATSQEIKESANRPLYIVEATQGGRSMAKDGRISKAALEQRKYTCQINPKHETFTTARGVPYMEGHHLIPCTLANAEIFWEKFNRNIDCAANIVCICPNCHRAVHFGDKNTKEAMLKLMYEQQTGLLRAAGIKITEKELLNLYKPALPVPELTQLAGIAKGACKGGYRERVDSCKDLPSSAAARADQLTPEGSGEQGKARRRRGAG